MLAFGCLMRPFSGEPWFLVATDAIDTARRGIASVEGSRAESRSSSQSVVAGLAEVAPPVSVEVTGEEIAPSRPRTRSASARQSPLVLPVASGSGDAGDPMVVDDAEVCFFLLFRSVLLNCV